MVLLTGGSSGYAQFITVLLLFGRRHEVDGELPEAAERQ